MTFQNISNRTYALVLSSFLISISLIFHVLSPILSIPTGFGMRIDLVAVPILLIFFLFGFEYAVSSLFLLSIFLFILPTDGGIVGPILKFLATFPMLVLPSIYLIFKSKFSNNSSLIAFLFSTIYTFAFSSLVFLSSTIPKPEGLSWFPFEFLSIVVLSFITYASVKTFYPKQTMDLAPILKNKFQAFFILILSLFVRGITTAFSNLYFAGPIYFKTTPIDYVAFLESIKLPILNQPVPWFFLIFFWNSIQGFLEFSLAYIIAFKFNFIQKANQHGSNNSDKRS